MRQSGCASAGCCKTVGISNCSVRRAASSTHVFMQVQTSCISSATTACLGIAAAPLKTFGENHDPKTGEALRGLLTLEATKFQYTQGAHHLDQISPDAWMHDQALLDRPGNAEIQLALFADYASNVKSYPAWHEYLRKHQPPTLIVWGRNDPYFTVKNIDGFRRDLKTVEVHLLDGGHFALEKYTGDIAEKISNFFAK